MKHVVSLLCEVMHGVSQTIRECRDSKLGSLACAKYHQTLNYFIIISLLNNAVSATK
jgi:hypothetical protein